MAVRWGERQYTQWEMERLQDVIARDVPEERIDYRKGPRNSQLPYLEHAKAVEIANEVFGTMGWACRIDETHQTYAVQMDGRWHVGYRVTMTVMLPNGAQHSDIGWGDAQNMPAPADAHEKAMKSAVSDARKRALRVFGRATGLSLYDKKYLDTIATNKKRRLANPPARQEVKTHVSERPVHRQGQGQGKDQANVDRIEQKPDAPQTRPTISSGNQSNNSSVTNQQNRGQQDVKGSKEMYSDNQANDRSKSRQLERVDPNQQPPVQQTPAKSTSGATAHEPSHQTPNQHMYQNRGKQQQHGAQASTTKVEVAAQTPMQGQRQQNQSLGSRPPHSFLTPQQKQLAQKGPVHQAAQVHRRLAQNQLTGNQSTGQTPPIHTKTQTPHSGAMNSHGQTQYKTPNPSHQYLNHQQNRSVQYQQQQPRPPYQQKQSAQQHQQQQQTPNQIGKDAQGRQGQDQTPQTQLGHNTKSVPPSQRSIPSSTPENPALSSEGNGQHVLSSFPQEDMDDDDAFIAAADAAVHSAGLH